MKKHISFFVMILIIHSVTQLVAQTTERPRPKEWSQLVFGGRFMDRFLPMPAIGQLTSDTWGGSNVLPRYTELGIENRKWSYWGGNIKLAKDGKYHLFVCGWLESSPKGHHEWPNSIVFHAVSSNSFGPFVVKDTIGKGHNPEVFQLSDGRYVLYVIGGYYLADSPDGPWTYGHFDFNQRDRKLIEGNSNFTFAQREDGSYLMICRGGGQWFSKTGLTPYGQVTPTLLGDKNRIIPQRAYPQRPGNFEDPVVWRDQVQYNLIVNDWLGRIALYMRSKDGVSWKCESGEAYLPGVSVKADGTVEKWFKYERLKILQDKYGRAIQGNFAVIDIEKDFDKPNDIHSSKNIPIPLTPGRLLTILNDKAIDAGTKTIRVKVASEPGFDPQKDMDLKSIQFGDPEAVNYGKGAKLLKSEKSGSDMILTFDATKIQFAGDEFAAKMIGKTSEGKLLFGYARLPGIDFKAPILSPMLPVFEKQDNHLLCKVEVQNFGLSASKKTKLQIDVIGETGQPEKLIILEVPALKPYEKADVQTTCKQDFFKPQKAYLMKVTVDPGSKSPVVLHGNVTPLH